MRFPLQTAVKFWWANISGERQHGEGRSRDISEHGAFVLTPVCPPIGSSVSLRIDLEGIPDEIGTLPVEVSGEVLRVEQFGAEIVASGFAIQY
jgi:hypothetical protein